MGFRVRQRLLQSAFSPEDTFFCYLKQLRSVKSQPPHLGKDPKRELQWRTDSPGVLFLFFCHKRICSITIKNRNCNRICVYVILFQGLFKNLRWIKVKDNPQKGIFNRNKWCQKVKKMWSCTGNLALSILVAKLEGKFYNLPKPYFLIRKHTRRKKCFTSIELYEEFILQTLI